MPFYNYSDKILPNLCKGVARSKGFFILLAYAREILGIIAEDFWLVLCLFTTTPNKILPNLCKGVARSKVFLILLAYAREILGDYCRGFEIQLLRTKILPNLCKGVARSKVFYPARLRSRDS